MEEFKEYVIGNENQYIAVNKNGSQITTGDIKKAKIFSTYEKASSFQKSIKNTLKQFNWEVKTIVNKIEDNPKNTNEIIGESFTYRKTIFEEESFDWNKMVDNLEVIQKDLKQYQENLKIKCKENEKEICDIYHYIEFFNLSASAGFKAYQMLQARLKERRRLKDDMMRTGNIINFNHDSVCNGALRRSFDGLNHRKYEPRVLKELFEV